jgi:uncharacterized cupredoxin-like copper-binding protein
MRSIAVVASFALLLLLSLPVGVRSTGSTDEASPSPTATRCPSPLGTPVASPPASPETSPEASPSPEPICVAVTEGEYVIQSERTTFQVGQAYIFAVGNEGNEVHEFVIERAGAEDEPLEVDGREVELEDIAPGQVAELEFTFTEPGRYQFACHVTGHYEEGMVLEIDVVP